MLARADFSSLFDVLQNGEDISAGNAETDSRLSELYRVYLQPLGCESLLMVPICYHDWTAGVLWFEQERMSQGWLGEEVSFAHAIANMLALRFSADRKSIPAPVNHKDETAGAEDSAAPGVGIATAVSDIRSEHHPDTTDRTDEQTKHVSTYGTGRFTSFLDRLAVGGIDPDQTAADIYEDTTVLALRFTDPISLAGRIVDYESTTTFDLMVGYLEEVAASQGNRIYENYGGGDHLCGGNRHRFQRPCPSDCGPGT